MLSVVEMGVLITHTACASAELHRAFEHGNRDTAIGQRDGCGHARVAAADHCDFQFFSHVFIANHNL